MLWKTRFPQATACFYRSGARCVALRSGGAPADEQEFRLAKSDGFGRAHGHFAFDRQGGRLRLNDAGRKLLPLADDLLSRTKHLPQVFGKTPSEPLRLGVTESVAAHYLMPSLAEFRRSSGRFPRVRIGNTDEMIRALIDYKLDLALVEGIVTDPDMAVTLWREERLFIVAAVGHPLQNQTVSWEDLRKVDWVLREPGSGSRLFFESHLRENWGTISPFWSSIITTRFCGPWRLASAYHSCRKASFRIRTSVTILQFWTCRRLSLDDFPS